LPGYNFSTLALSAYKIPSLSLQSKRDEYLSRPRFLAILNLHARAIVYHEGSRLLIIARFWLCRDNTSGWLTTSVKPCELVAIFILRSFGRQDVCIQWWHFLPKPLTSCSVTKWFPSRLRDRSIQMIESGCGQGYDLLTGVRRSPRQDWKLPLLPRVRSGRGSNSTLTYGRRRRSGASNLGPTRRKKKEVRYLVLDQERGSWGKRGGMGEGGVGGGRGGGGGADESADDPLMHVWQNDIRVIPYGRYANCLLVRAAYSSCYHQQMTPLRAALKIAIQVHYQLENNELGR